MTEGLGRCYVTTRILQTAVKNGNKKFVLVQKIFEIHADEESSKSS